MSHSYYDICPKCGAECYSREAHTCPIPRQDAINLHSSREQEFLDDRDGVLLSQAERNLKDAHEVYMRSDDWTKEEKRS